MAGSYSRIVDDNGNFTMDLIDNMGDAHEALQNCFNIITRDKKTLKKYKETLQWYADSSNYNEVGNAGHDTGQRWISDFGQLARSVLPLPRKILKSEDKQI